MNDIGMAVDVSHCGDQTTLDAFELSTKPVLITHSNCRALAPGHPRCKTDEAIRAMAAKGGVMGVTAVRNFVRNDEPTTIEHYIDHIDHIAKLVGIEHAGIGTDSDLRGYDALPPEIYEWLKAGYNDSYAFRDKIDIEGMNHPKKMYDLTEGLIQRGYNDSDIHWERISDAYSARSGHRDVVKAGRHLLSRTLGIQITVQDYRLYLCDGPVAARGNQPERRCRKR
jgi:membrane dipeptidase